MERIRPFLHPCVLFLHLLFVGFHLFIHLLVIHIQSRILIHTFLRLLIYNFLFLLYDFQLCKVYNGEPSVTILVQF